MPIWEHDVSIWQQLGHPVRIYDEKNCHFARERETFRKKHIFWKCFYGNYTEISKYEFLKIITVEWNFQKVILAILISIATTPHCITWQSFLLYII